MTDSVSSPGTGPIGEMPGFSRRSVFVDLVIIVAWFAAAGVAVAFVWQRIVTPAEFIRTADNLAMGQAELAKRVNADGWFMTLGAGVSALGGSLVIWRSTLPWLSLLVGTVASYGSARLALAVGERLGHSDVAALARAAEPGASVPDSLRVASPAVMLAWVFALLLTTTLIGFGRQGRHSPDHR